MMDALDGLKQKWANQHGHGKPYDATEMSHLIRERMRKHTREPMKFFWASFVLQIIVYALYAHVTVRFYDDPVTVTFALVGVSIFIPFTVVLMRRFKQMAVLKPDGKEVASVQDYVNTHKDLLHKFFRFKIRYELFLIPLSTFCGTVLVFHIYMPGGPLAYPYGVMITVAVALISCYLAIRKENRRSFRVPLSQLDDLLREFEQGQNL